ncbi:hypothetical protein Moror_10004 [Moniliophthora roreri MCA 2997]|uniref:DUF6534 domain-containing protein n=1 Tax=Moniliophthora roreri (strain MCA 2997) TaxID=1381753 RepID=V2WZH3_MONRO|nr:hypothetical protein Moror_10004 [Moniliophthora roreri MCA 2997]
MSEGISHMAGPLLLGYMLNWGLYGVLTVQIHTYWTAFPNDTLYARILVYGIYLLETTQTVLLTHDAFRTFVFGFMDPSSVDDIHNLWLDVYLFDGLVASCVQVFYAYRIRVLLSKSKLLPGIIVLLSITHFTASVHLCFIMREVRFFSAYHESTLLTRPISGLIWIGTSLITDTLIAITMIYALSRYDTTSRETQDLVRRLSRLAMETCSLVAAAHIIQPFLFFLIPTKNYSITPAMTATKLYSNSLLVVFNTRVCIHDARGTGNREETDWGTSIHVTANRDEIPLSTRGWIPSTFPSHLDSSVYRWVKI